MNKKTIILLIIIIFIISVVFFVLKQNPSFRSTDNEVGSFSKTTINIKNYAVEINSQKKGNPGPDSYFSTSFSIKDKYGNNLDYDVSFLDIKSENENDYITSEFNIDNQSTVKINGKGFKYYIDTDKLNALLVYEIPKETDSLIIKIAGNAVFDPNGSVSEKSAIIDKSVLESKELASILNFSITKLESSKDNSNILDIINNNSTLPLKYLSKFDRKSKELSKYELVENYMSLDYSNSDITLSFYGYPNEESDFCLSKIDILSNKYNLLGVTVGDEINEAISKIEKYGFKLEKGNTNTFKYKKFTIKLETDSKKNDNKISSLYIEAESEYLGN